MRTRYACAAVWVLLFVASAVAQSGGRPSDPVTGKWGSNGATYLELQYNGEGAVTGTTIWRHGDSEQRAPITKGVFDGETGVLELFGEAKDRDDKVVQYAVQGRLERGTLSGTYTIGGDHGKFTFRRQ